MCAKYLGDVRALKSKRNLSFSSKSTILLNKINSFVPLYPSMISPKQAAGVIMVIGLVTRIKVEEFFFFFFSEVSRDRKNDPVLKPLDQSPCTQNDSPLVSIYLLKNQN